MAGRVLSAVGLTAVVVSLVIWLAVAVSVLTG